MKLPQNIKGNNRIRDAKICQLWLEGELTNDNIGSQFSLSVSTINRIVYKNRAALVLDKEYEKTKRIRWYKAQLRNRPTKRDAADLHEALRKEIEGDRPLIDQSTHNNLIQYVWQADNNTVQPPALPESNTRLPEPV